MRGGGGGSTRLSGSSLRGRPEVEEVRCKLGLRHRLVEADAFDRSVGGELIASERGLEEARRVPERSSVVVESENLAADELANR